MLYTFHLPFDEGSVTVRYDASIDNDASETETNIREMLNIIDSTRDHESE